MHLPSEKNPKIEKKKFYLRKWDFSPPPPCQILVIWHAIGIITLTGNLNLPFFELWKELITETQN